MHKDKRPVQTKKCYRSVCSTLHIAFEVRHARCGGRGGVRRMSKIHVNDATLIVNRPTCLECMRVWFVDTPVCACAVVHACGQCCTCLVAS